MSRLFISHSSHDAFEAIAFHDWLVSEGWRAEDVFLDIHGIGPGERWRDALNKANERCEAIVLLASPASLSSAECRLEVRMAEDYGKEIIVAILYLLKPDGEELGIYSDRQIVDLSQDPRDVALRVEHKGQGKTVLFNRRILNRIKARLDQLGISPGRFSWRPGNIETASPYPGIEGFSQREAGLFFGRAGDVARGLSELRRMRRLGSDQVLVVQAASGAGKSSFLKAGLWPRLLRDPEVLPISILRPATGILTGEHGLGRQLSSFFASHGVTLPADEVYRLFDEGLEDAASGLARLINNAIQIAHATQLSVRSDAPIPTPIIAVDQAEELFGLSDREESRIFLQLVSRLLSKEGYPDLLATPIFIWTIRADQIDALLHQTEPVGLKAPKPFLLPPIASNAYREVIEAPIAVANQAGMKLALDPLLVDTLIDNSTGSDALPLLAFTLRQLLDQNRVGETAQLTLEQFVSAGGMAGVLRNRLSAVEKSFADYDPADLRRLLIPNLASWDVEAIPPVAKRLVADEAVLFSGQRAHLKPLADGLVEARLLTRSGDSTRKTYLEVAHEAILRLPPVSDWLIEDREFLTWRDRVGVALRAYEAGTRDLLGGRELQIARDWLASRAEVDDIPHACRTFIQDSDAAERRRIAEEERREREWQESERKTKVQAQRTEAGMLSNAAALALENGQPVVAALLALRALPDPGAGINRELVTEAQVELDRALRFMRELVVYGGHAGAVTSAVLDAGGEFVLTASDDGAARVWEARSGKELARLDGHPRMVTAAKFSPDGHRILTASYDGAVRLWDTSRGEELAKLLGHSDRVTAAAFSADGSRILTAGRDGVARIYDSASGDVLFSYNFAGAPGFRVVVSFSPDGARMVVGSDTDTDGAILASVLNIGVEGAPQARLDGHKKGITFAGFSPDGRLIVTTGRDRTVRVWEAGTGEQLVNLPVVADVDEAVISPTGDLIAAVCRDMTVMVWARHGAELAKLVGHTKRLRSARFSPDEKLLVTASDDGTARIWDPLSGTEVVRFEGHKGPVRSAEFSPDASRVITASSDETARLWEVFPGDEISLPGWLSSSSTAVSPISPDQTKIVTVGKEALVWDMATGRQLMKLDGHDEFSAFSVSCACFNPKADALATSSSDGSVRTWSLESGSGLAVLAGHTEDVRKVRFSPDGLHILTSSEDRTVRIWNATSGQQVACIQPGFDGCAPAFFMPDSSRVVTTDGTNTTIWDVLTGTELLRLEGAFSYLTESGALSPDGMQIITKNENRVFIWDTINGRKLSQLPDQIGEVVVAGFSPDGTRVLTSARDMGARLWDANTGRELLRLEGHAGRIILATFSSDGRRIATSSYDGDGSARIWDAVSGKQIARIEIKNEMGGAKANRKHVHSMAFSSDGDRIVVCLDGFTRICRIRDAGQLVDFAKRRVPRYLTIRECRRYFLPEEPPDWCLERDLWPYSEAAKLSPADQLSADIRRGF